jgi:hypothetical protein
VILAIENSVKSWGLAKSVLHSVLCSPQGVLRGWALERRGRMVRMLGSQSWVPVKALRGICEHDTLKSTARRSHNKQIELLAAPLTSVKKDQKKPTNVDHEISMAFKMKMKFQKLPEIQIYILYFHKEFVWLGNVLLATHNLHQPWQGYYTWISSVIVSVRMSTQKIDGSSSVLSPFKHVKH